MQKKINLSLFERQFLTTNKKNLFKENIFATRYQLLSNRYQLMDSYQTKAQNIKNIKNISNKTQKIRIKIKKQAPYGNFIQEILKSPYLNDQSIKEMRQSSRFQLLRRKIQKSLSATKDIRYPPNNYKLKQINKKYSKSSLTNNFFVRAKIYYNNQQYKQCIIMLGKLPLQLKNHFKVHYYKGMSYINQNQLNIGVKYLEKCIQLNPQYKKNIYLVLAQSYKKLNKINQSLSYLTICLQKFPTYYECLIFRGKIYLQKNLYQNAKLDFNLACQLNPQKSYAYFGKGQAQLHLKQYYQALQSYNKAIQIDKKPLYYQQRGCSYYYLLKYQKALIEFQKCNFLTSVNYHRGMTYYQLHQYNQSILYFQQCLKTDTIEQNKISALQTMIKIKIQQKYIQQAYSIYNRVDNLDINPNKLQNWKSFLEACLCLIKKKYQQSINIFKKMLDSYPYNEQYKNLQNQDSKIIYKFLKPKIYVYKAYGQLNLKNQEIAKLDYLLYDQLINQLKINEDNTSKRYNQFLILSRQNFSIQSLNYLQKASKLFPQQIETYLLTPFSIINNIQEEGQLTQNDLQQILYQITTGINNLSKLQDNNLPSFYYYRAIIYLYCKNFNNSLADIDKAIQITEDNTPKYFYLRGLILSCSQKYAQAIQNFIVCINLDSNFAPAYLQKCKCLKIQKNIDQAFEDLKKYIMLTFDEDPSIDKYAVFILFQKSEYQKCLAITQGAKQINNEVILIQAKCYLVLGQFQQSIEYFNKYKQLASSTEYMIDIAVIDIISNINQKITNQQLQKLLLNLNNFQQKHGSIFKYGQICQLRGSLQLLLGNYKQALQFFFQSLGLLQKQTQNKTRWVQNEIKYNLALCFLCLQMYDDAQERIQGYQRCKDKGKDSQKFIQLVQLLNKEKFVNTDQIKLQTFLQEHKISKNWPKVKLKSYQVYLPLCFSYPFVESSPQIVPTFDRKLLKEFHVSKLDIQPQAPWMKI